MESNSDFFINKMVQTNQSTTSSINSRYLKETLLIDAYQQVLNLQVSLINELNLNKKLIMQFIVKNRAKSIANKAKSTDVGTQKISASFIFKSDSASQNPLSQKIQNRLASESSSVQKPRKKKKIVKKVSSGSCYNPSSENSEKNRAKTVRQTKHIPKNYGKAIINFMMRNPNIIEELCLTHQKNLEQFWKVVQSFKGKIYTVANLKSMWIQEDNPFAKIFRIVSMLYLRMHCLEHIFNSRVENYTRHIKYRYKIMEAVTDPESFTRIKQY